MSRMRFTPAVRISLGLVLFTMTLLMSVDMLGLLPDPLEEVLEMRKKVCESLAIYGSLAVQDGDAESIQTTIQLVLSRNEDILSAALRAENGIILAEAGDHQRHWRGARSDRSTPTDVLVPIFKDERRWGTFEVCFKPIYPEGILGLWAKPIIKLIVFVIPLAFVGYLLFMKKTLRHLDPSSVVPARVKSALDALVEGVILLDNRERIVLTNTAFAKKVGQPADSLMGHKASELKWTVPKSQEQAKDFPWMQAMLEGKSQAAIPLSLQNSKNGGQTFMVNGAPILDGGGKIRGALATFDDITKLEAQNDQLQKMLKKLKKSRDKVHSQNQKLQILATLDPLTSCLNRRSFFERFEAEFNRAQRYGHGLSCVMVDIDHFKSINDKYGHQTGDRVLQKVSHTLRSSLRENDVICRYGGEEFCIILSHIDAENAVKTANRFRVAIASMNLPEIKVTVSMGVSSLEFEADNPQKLIGQADSALYAAKDSGRNRVVRWDEEDLCERSEDSKSELNPVAPEDAVDVYIPQHVVNALMMAMAHRDVATAEHSRQVGDLCAAAAQGLMSLNDCFVLEVAGLLHDIGKLGVPDSILLKPGPLTEEEWELMRDHERRSVEVIASTFLSPELVKMVRYHHAWYGKKADNSEQPSGKDIPLGARILSIADSFSAMVSHRPYSRARSYEEAFEELRRFAGEQFDPDLVEHFIKVVQARDGSRQKEIEPVSNAVKLEIGREVEKLFVAVNTSAYGMLAGIAYRLATKAAKHGLTLIAEKAAQIEKATEGEYDLIRIMQLASELMKVCGSKETFKFEDAKIHEKTRAA